MDHQTPPPAFADPTMTSTTSPTTLPTTKPQASTPPSALQDIAFGSLAGTLGKLVEYPFDTVKVRLQSQPDHLPLRYTGPLDCFKQGFQSDGVRGLYRGVSAPLAGAAAETASLFWSYGVAQEVLRKSGVGVGGEGELGLGGKVTAGGISGGMTAFILTPIELVKCRMQVPLHSPLDPTLHSGATRLTSATLSPFAVIADVFRREGLLGFWRGHLGTFLRETGGTAAWFGGWEATTLYLKTRLASQHSPTTLPTDVALPLSQQMFAGAIAGMSYNFLFYPADTIKSKIQTGELTTSGVRPTFAGVGKELWRVHGLKGLYRGCGITVARSAPSSALIFSVVENLKGWFA